MKKGIVRKNKEVTNFQILTAIGELSQAVGSKFERVDFRFDEVAHEFKRVHRELGDLQYQITRVESLLLQNHEKRIKAIEQKLGLEV